MTYLVDTHWVADWLAGRAAAVTLLTDLSRDGMAISLVTYGEISEGVDYGRDPKSAEAAFRRFLRGVDVLPLGREIMKRFARLRGALRRQGRLIGDPDVLIAATALAHDLTLVSRNIRHFARLPQVRLYQETPRG